MRLHVEREDPTKIVGHKGSACRNVLAKEAL